MKTKTLYFSHDFNASSDDKIVYLCEKFGGIAYGFYWHVIEKMHTEAENKIFIKPYSLGSIAKFLKIDISLLKEIIDYSINECELFESDGESFWSERVFKNVEKYDEYIEGKKRGGAASAAARAAAKAEKDEEERLSNSSTQLNTCSTGVQHNSTGVQHNSTDFNTAQQTKLNKSKVNESELNKNEVKYSNETSQNDTFSELQNTCKNKIEIYEETFLTQDLQNFIDLFKNTNVTEQEIKTAMYDFKLNKMTCDKPQPPYNYKTYKDWFKKYLTDNRQKYKHELTFRVVSISDKATREDLHTAFKFYWQNEYTIDFIKERVLSGEYPPKIETVHFDNLIKNKLIEVTND